LVRDGDYVVASPADGEWVAGLPLLLSARPGSPEEGYPLDVYGVTDAQRPRYRQLAVDVSQVTASDHIPELPGLLDGDATTSWSTKRPQRRGDWIEVAFAAPTAVSRVELAMGRQANRWGENLRILGALQGGEWTPLVTASARAPAPEQRLGGRSQVFLLEGQPLGRLRIEQQDLGGRPWAIAELRLWALDETGGDR
jgi:F5/8 type C domain-containing protein